jgi:hypothetical protein
LSGESKLARDRREGSLDSLDNTLPTLWEVDAEAFPFSTKVSISGNAWRSSGIYVESGHAIRFEVLTRGALASASSPQRLAGDEYPEPYRAPDAVLIRLGDSVAALDRMAVFFAPQAGELEFLLNEPSEEASVRARVSWGQPTIAYRPQLDLEGLRGRPEPIFEDSRTIAVGEAWQALVDLQPGARVWISTQAFDAKGRALRSATTAPEVALLPNEELDDAQRSTGQGPALAVRAADSAIQGVNVAGQRWLVAQDGELDVRVSESMSGGQDVATHVVDVAVYPPLDHLLEWLPWPAFGDERAHSINASGVGYEMVMDGIEVGDIVRIEVLPQDADSPQMMAFLAGGRQERSPAASDEASAWLVPGGRKEAYFVRIGEWQRELTGSDVFYAPVEGDLEIGRNDCAGRADTSETTQCYAELEVARPNVVVRVGRATN